MTRAQPTRTACLLAAASRRLAWLSRVPAALWPSARFLFGPAYSDPLEVALHRALVTGANPGVPADALAAAARRGQVVVLAYETLPALKGQLALEALHHRRADAMLELGLAHAERGLHSVGPVALLKGSAAAAWVYPETAWRQRRDLDLLVGSALPEARRALLGAGWKDANDPRHGFDANVVRAWNMAIELGGGVVHLDLHRDLVHTAWCTPDIPLMLASRVAGRSLLPVLCPSDTMINTAIHLLGTGFHEPLKGWIDLLRLLPLVSPQELAERARAHGLVTGMWVVLGVLGRWFDAPVFAYREALGRPPLARSLGYLSAGEHETPERRPLPRGVAYRLWPWLVRDQV